MPSTHRPAAPPPLPIGLRTRAAARLAAACLAVAIWLPAPLGEAQVQTTEPASAAKAAAKPAAAEEASRVAPWEYYPYRVHCWFVYDPALGWDAAQKAQAAERTASELERRFGPAATITHSPPPREVAGDLLYGLEGLRVDTLLGRELLIATSPKNSLGKELRTIEAVLEKAEAIPVTAGAAAAFRGELLDSGIDTLVKAADKLKPAELPTADLQGRDPLAVALATAQIPIAVVSRADALADRKLIRVLPVQYPWQLHSTLDRYDKIIIVALRREDATIAVESRQIDCVLRSVSEIGHREVPFVAGVPVAAASLAAEAFVPYVRLESAEGLIAGVRVRAGQLVDSPDNPCHIGVGDVLQPIVRRDNQAGEPTLIQTIPWTFLVATDGADAKFRCAVYSGVRGALLGRPNRRLHKLATLVKPVHEATELRLEVAGSPGKIIPGSGVYRRTPGTEDLEFVGRTDWRGIIRIEHSANPLVQYELPAEPAAGGEPTAAPEQTAAAEPTTAPQVVATPVSNPAPDAASPADAAKPTDAAKPAGDAAANVRVMQTQANAPLYLYYVKNGSSLLARLPIVTGLESVQVAELPDDSRRLEAEAFIKGLENQIFDTVARRRLLAERIRRAIADNKLEEAEKLFAELRATRDYKYFSDELNAIQQRILAPGGGPVTNSDQRRIDKMFQSTRTAMQQYLQDTLVRDVEVSLSNLRGS